MSFSPTAPSRDQHLHPSIHSHLGVELALLHLLQLRSRDQHRSSIFLRRTTAVYRLGRRLETSLSSQRPSDHLTRHESADTKTTAPQGDVRMLSDLVAKFIGSLISARDSTTQIIRLHHFLPLQTLLLAIYGRLFTIALNIAMWLEMGLVNNLPTGISIFRHREIQERQGDLVRIGVHQDKDGAMVDIGGVELGERITRSPPTGGGLSHSPAPRQTNLPPALALQSSAVSDTLQYSVLPRDFIDTVPFSADMRAKRIASTSIVAPTADQNRTVEYRLRGQEFTSPRRTKRPIPAAPVTVKVKKQRRNTMDDIFGT